MEKNELKISNDTNYLFHILIKKLIEKRYGYNKK